MVVYVHRPEDYGIDIVHDEDLWISWYKVGEVHVKGWWGWMVTDLLGDGRGCSGIRVHLQTVVMELVFRAESFCFGDHMVCVREIAKEVFGFHLYTWIQFIGKRGRFGG